ncbi:undecaprenyldiphospho-muramoylpentapeptide beta-N-acetylglucosaminyltransferase [Endomicrobium proavitum]|uniref:UDP-N-acetylglucosamine--N-acetylmuramyl-(pentapeptide) pyrophosphoryl-undecaprenol N-acetylglucosamine transferase n=1 Tax=Endomicrobium proavitum TaxID=1408281 RepID=A0A0G3WIG5_9BACT|nr:undecaprenyldiphospho-muramoylpentapeptide beta-N-acetylglucosaminyltransferase [Endomicrobium proavitum]AKL97680.1 putative UDP-N-acetylglucosamine--N-acetylmuramyl-(pentapeptide) pyrophosphoryl-undecaprenol N-acetylglucosamine transferase [Endomicrobium proavitum]
MTRIASKKIIIAASGTGGHIYPGISLAREFERNGYDVTFFIGNNETSVKILTDSGLKYIAFNMSGMPRKFSFAFIKFLFKLAKAFLKSFCEIKKINPDIVIGTGGYISVPAIAAAGILGRKTYIHEQNAIPGAANKLLAKIADKVFVSFKDSVKYFKNKNVIVSGYPVRRDIVNVSKDEALKNLNAQKDIYTVLVFGGSLGAVKLNETAFDALDKFSLKEKIQVFHITGSKNFALISEKAKNKKNYFVFEYMHNIADAYAVSDIVICRSGAGAVFELKALNKPAVLVPYPFATDNHQFFNAKEIEKPRFAEVIEEKNLNAQSLLSAIEQIKSSKSYPVESKSLQLPQETIFKEIINV